MKQYKQNIVESTGVGTLEVVQIILIVLKLLKVIDWNWWLILVPFWVGIGATCLVLGFMIADYHISKKW